MAQPRSPAYPLGTRLNRRRVVAAISTFGIGLGGAGLAGCSVRSRSSGGQAVSGNQGQGQPRTGGTFNSYLAFNARLDPQKLSANGQQVVSGVLSRIFRFKTGTDPKATDDHDLENDLGIGVEAPDASAWTVKLRPDARFQNIAPVNGHAVEAEDIKSTFARALAPPTADPNRGALSMIDAARIETPDPTTVVFKLNYPYAPFQKTLASPTYSWIYPREALGNGYDPSKQVIGSGPFSLESFTPDVAYVYKRNPQWFEKGLPAVDGMRVAVIPETAQQLAQFSAGSLDEYFPTIDDLDAAKRQNPRALVIKADNGSPYSFRFQLGDPGSPFQDLRVRQAFSMAIDRDTLSKALYAGESEQMVLVPAYMGKWALKVDDLKPNTKQFYQFNPGEAKRLLAAAGQSNLQLKLAYVVNGGGNFGPLYVKMAEAVANMLNAIGVKTTLVQEDFNKDYVDSGKGIRQGFFDKDTAVFSAVGFFSDADEWLFGYFHSKSTSNGEHLTDPALDAMIDNERSLVNEAERLNAVKAIQQYVADKLYIAATIGTYNWVMVQPRVRNYQYSSTLGTGTETYAKLWLNA